MTQTEATGGGILLTGATGMVGQALARAFKHREIRLVQAIRGEARTPADSRLETFVHWQPWADEAFADTSVLENLDVAIHLSGANLAARRWTAAYKQEIVQSRIVTTRAIARTLARLARPPRLLISASATGIYGDRGDELLTDASPPGLGFLSEGCQAWEAATAAASGIRVIHLRLGVVLDPGGGALAKVLPLFRAGLGGRLGSGRQWMSWIAMDDLVRAVLHITGYGDVAVSVGEATSGAVADSGLGKVAGVGSDQVASLGSDAVPVSAGESPAGFGLPAAQISGAVNCISPVPVTNAEYTQALSAVLHRPAFAAAPAFALRLALGEMADAALLSSCRAVPEKLLASGFRFRYPEIAPALAHLLRR